MSEISETLGQRLKAERERKGLTAQKAADELHLEAWVIGALESGDYARIGPAVYGKGHLKRYAALLGLPAAEVLEGYDALSSAPLPPAKAVTMQMRTSAPAGSELSRPAIAGSAIAALVLAGVLWWRPWHPRAAAPASAAPASAVASAALSEGQSDEPELASTESERERPGAVIAASTDGVPGSGGAATSAGAAGVRGASSPVGAASSGGVPGLAGVPNSGGATRGGAATSVGSTAIASGRTPAVGRSDTDSAGVGRARLRLSFTSDSWVDVRDAAGLRVYAGNGRANSVKIVAGAAPLRVYLKSASGVQLEINNHAVAIGRQFVAGDVARFEAGADGVLRRDSHDTASRNARPRD
jgi:cytoskeleton protein RodZ